MFFSAKKFKPLATTSLKKKSVLCEIKKYDKRENKSLMNKQTI